MIHVFTPYDTSIRLKKNLSRGISCHKYSQNIGSLLHLTNVSRPNIAYAVGRLERYTHHPDHSQWTAIERVFRYLKRTINYDIYYTCFLALIEGFSDANWIFYYDETKSTSDYAFTLAGGAISWKLAKQIIMFHSTMEAEIIALDTATCEVEFLKNFLCNFPLLNEPIPPISMHCDSQVAIYKVTSKNFNEKKDI